MMTPSVKEVMKPMIAVRRHLVSADGKEVPIAEFAAFWRVCNEDEKREYALTSAKALGVELSYA